MPKRGDIVDYEVPQDAQSVANATVGVEETVPMIVVAVDDEAKSHSGFAFLPDGTTSYVTVTEPEPEPEPVRKGAFDPETGKRWDDESDDFKYDPMTGQPLSSETPAYDRQTGSALNTAPDPNSDAAPDPSPVTSGDVNPTSPATPDNPQGANQ